MRTEERSRALLAAAETRVEGQRRLLALLRQKRRPTVQAEELLSILEATLDNFRRVVLTRALWSRRAFTSNRLLSALSNEDFELLAPHLRPVNLELDEVIIDAGSQIEAITFIETGVTSIVNSDALDAKEIGLVGNEGLVGYGALLGAGSTPHRSIVRVEGNGLQVRRQLLDDACRQSDSLRDLVLRYAYVLGLQTGGGSAAGKDGSVRARVARRLLMWSDRTGSVEVKATHSSVAEALGVRRAGVTEALHELESTHALIATRAAHIILDRSQLQTAAGELYGQAESEYARLIA